MEIGNIYELSTALKSMEISNAISVSVMKKNLDMQTQMSSEMVKMMELSVNPNVGSNFDIKL